MRFHEVNFNKFSLCSFQFATSNEMNSTCDFKLRLFCCLWLCLALCERGLCQDITPDFPEDFPTSTEPATTTTTTEAATTREAIKTTTTQASTTTTAATTTTTEAHTKPPTTTPSYWYLPPRQPTMRPFYYPTYAPPSSPPVPAYTPAYHFPWDLDNSGEERCYLKNQVERSYFRWCCHCEYIEQIKAIYRLSSNIIFPGSHSLPSVSCYRCCYYGYNRFAGCSKLHSGQCTPDSIGSRYRK